MSEISGPYWDFYGGPLSNFAPSPIRAQHPFAVTETVEFPTVENLYQAWKATTREDFDAIATEPDTWKAKKIGNTIQLRSDWEEIKCGVMLYALRQKYAIPEYRDELLRTTGHWIREDSPTDFIWGYRQGGLNLLGLALMVVRLEITPAPAPESDYSGSFARNDDFDSARVAGEGVEKREGKMGTLKPGSHRHKALLAYGQATEELTATEAGLIATPGHDRVSGGTRRTYDLRAMRLVQKGERGFTITNRGREVLAQLERGEVVETPRDAVE